LRTGGVEREARTHLYVRGGLGTVAITLPNIATQRLRVGAEGRGPRALCVRGAWNAKRGYACSNEVTDKSEAMPYPEASDLYKHLYEGAWEPWQ